MRRGPLKPPAPPAVDPRDRFIGCSYTRNGETYEVVGRTAGTDRLVDCLSTSGTRVAFYIEDIRAGAIEARPAMAA